MKIIAAGTLMFSMSISVPALGQLEIGTKSEGISSEWLMPYPEVYEFLTQEQEEEPPVYIDPCGPGELRDPRTLSCLPGVSEFPLEVPEINPCGAAASCTPGVGLEGAHDLIRPGMLQDELRK